MQKTTVYLDELTYRQLKRLAKARRRAPAAMVREAIAEYTARHAPKRRTPKSVGAFKSGVSDLGLRAEERLKGFGESR